MNVVFGRNSKLCTQDLNEKVNCFRMWHLLLLVDIGYLFITAHFFIELKYSFMYSAFELLRYFLFFIFLPKSVFIHKRRIIDDSIIIEFCIMMHIMLLFHFHSYLLSFPRSTNPYVFNSFRRLFIPFLFEVYSVVHFDYLILILSFFCSFRSVLFITHFLIFANVVVTLKVISVYSY
jgi:hypothetical protein